jgi:hypothetical protein
MLSHIEIRDFHSCKDVVLGDLGPFAVLGGPNTNASTQVLQAISWTAKTATSASPVIRTSGATGHVKLRALLDKTLYEYVLQVAPLGTNGTGNATKEAFRESLSIEVGGGPPLKILERDGPSVRLSGYSQSVDVAKMSPCLPALQSILPKDAYDRLQIRPMFSFLQSVRYCLCDEAEDADERGTVSRGIYDDWVENYEAGRSVSDSIVLRLLYLFHKHPSRFAELQAMMGTAGLGLLRQMWIREYPIATSSNGRLFVVYFEPCPLKGESPRGLSYDQLSRTARSMLRMAISLLLGRDSVLLLASFGETAKRSLRQRLVPTVKRFSGQGQVILATDLSTKFKARANSAVHVVHHGENGVAGNKLLRAARTLH